MGWFKRDGRRRTGRHGYGVPDVTAQRLAAHGALTTGRTAVLDRPEPSAPPAETTPARLPDDRTMEQIGGKVADVLWSYYAQQGASVTPSASPAALAAYDDSYDDAYDAALFAAQSHIESAPQEPVQPAALRAATREEDPWAPVLQPADLREAQRLAAATTAAPPVVTAAVPAPPRFRVYERRRSVSLPLAEPVVPERRILADRRVVQLGFMDGSTLELSGDDPAAKALRSAAAALTLRA
jgi:hypothetical protein